MKAGGRLMASPRMAESLPLKVAAVCYRKRGTAVEFLLVNTNGGNKWTFPKGSPEARLSHSQAAEREASEEAGGCSGHHRASPLPSLHPLQGRVLAAGRRAGICGQGFPDGNTRVAAARRTSSKSHVVQPGRSASAFGQGSRGQIRSRNRSRDRSRARAHSIPQRALGTLSGRPQQPRSRAILIRISQHGTRYSSFMRR